MLSRYYVSMFCYFVGMCSFILGLWDLFSITPMVVLDIFLILESFACFILGIHIWIDYESPIKQYTFYEVSSSTDKATKYYK